MKGQEATSGKVIDSFEQARNNAEVMLAFARGEKLESRPKGHVIFHVVTDPNWNFGLCEYRIAPRVRYVNVYEESEIKSSRQEADDFADGDRIACLKFKEGQLDD